MRGLRRQESDDSLSRGWDSTARPGCGVNELRRSLQMVDAAGGRESGLSLGVLRGHLARIATV
jgi:hypothetical protein